MNFRGKEKSNRSVFVPMHVLPMKLTLLFIFILYVGPVTAAETADPPMEDFVKVIKPILEKHCFSCHNDHEASGGVNLKNFFVGIENYEERMTNSGRLWMNVIKEVETTNMPPDGEPRMSSPEKEDLVKGIREILNKSLNARDPGRVVIRRLSHDEYQYTILSLLGVHFDAKAVFPSDGSGGAGFDNYANTLFFTPLRMEKYYEAAEDILEEAYNGPQWRDIVPKSYRESLWSKLVRWVKGFFSENVEDHNSVKAAEEVIIPFASKAFRRFLKPEEKEGYLMLFKKIYDSSQGKSRFDLAIKETLKGVLISPKFLYRYEEEQPVDHPYELSAFELASRISYFLWSSPPDKELFEIAYHGGLEDPKVLREQVRRMLHDPKTKRFSESFATQWFGINKLKDISPVDVGQFPDFTPSLRSSMYQEMVEYFHYVLTESKDFMELVDSDYVFVNEELARHYRIPHVEGDSMRKVTTKDRVRGGVLGMGSVLASTSLPFRTSPVKRGQFVLEQLLGTPAPPPPPDVAELSEEESGHENSNLRDILVQHRSNKACIGCHQKMDPIGFGLENFNAVGQWRSSYGESPIIAWDTLSSGEIFNGPGQLKEILVTKKELFARLLAEKMFTYAIGRKVDFTDELFMKGLTDNLLKNDFNTEEFILALTNSYPFRYRTNDTAEKFKLLTTK